MCMLQRGCNETSHTCCKHVSDLSGLSGFSQLAPPSAQVYVWGRRHPYVNLSFLGIFAFTAPYLPWVLLAFSVTLRSNALVDLLGIVAGAPL